MSSATRGASDDYFLTPEGPLVLVFHPGTISGTQLDVPVRIRNDDFVEAPETFQLSIEGLTSFASVIRGTPELATVTILDNDGEYTCMYEG